jgi:hypothetical protein
LARPWNSRDIPLARFSRSTLNHLVFSSQPHPPFPCLFLFLRIFQRKPAAYPPRNAFPRPVDVTSKSGYSQRSRPAATAPRRAIPGFTLVPATEDVRPFFRGELKAVSAAVTAAMARAADRETHLHLEDIKDQDCQGSVSEDRRVLGCNDGHVSWLRSDGGMAEPAHLLVRLSDSNVPAGDQRSLTTTRRVAHCVPLTCGRHFKGRDGSPSQQSRTWEERS